MCPSDSRHMLQTLPSPTHGEGRDPFPLPRARLTCQIACECGWTHGHVFGPRRRGSEATTGDVSPRTRRMHGCRIIVRM